MKFYGVVTVTWLIGYTGYGVCSYLISLAQIVGDLRGVIPR